MPTEFPAGLTNDTGTSSLSESAIDQTPPPATSMAINPPSIFVFNVGLTRTRHINDGPSYPDLSLLQSFINTLKSIEAKGYIVQGAMYGPEGVNIFIDTEDEDWYTHISCN